MFTKLTDFGYRRTSLEAVGFYVACTLGWSAVTMLAYVVVVQVLPQQSPTDVGRVVSVIGAATMTALVAWRKDLLNNFWSIALVVFAGTMAVFHGSLAGLIPAAYLTTHDADKTEDQTDQEDAGL